MKDKLDELHYIYKMIGNYGFRTVQDLLDKYNKQLDNWNKLKEIAKSQSGLKKKCHNGELWFEVDELLETMQELEGDVLK